MALTFSEGVAVATLVFTILAVLFVVPYVIVAFGFFPESGFASRVHPSNSAILKELAAMRKDIETLRKNSGSELEWFSGQRLTSKPTFHPQPLSTSVMSKL
ncbi:hypothetical protein L207DRAFT_589602 [Hyaloscypha variabilis F]|uniref:Uncharacterized protein n=1 Tax=Hyaloscypha variabilis (strain UAMH 11265 / GT02V1 / F) TaxID=1149755 RepID=A0A2J6R3Z1_HYAVF|nr:hypothetical protein L207DRAFT_589602 [Hyaloscypha variabilis F]